MEVGAQREARQPMLVVQEETPAVGVRAKDTEHETEAAAAAVTQSEVLAPEGRMDYDKLVDMFGCQRIDAALVHRIARLTSRPPHRFLRRGVFFAHRDLNSSTRQGRSFTCSRGWNPHQRRCTLAISSPSCSQSTSTGGALRCAGSYTACIIGALTCHKLMVSLAHHLGISV